MNTIGDDKFVAEVFLIRVQGSKAPLKVSCRWRFSEPTADGDAPQYFRDLDLLLSIVPISCVDADYEDNNEGLIPYATSTILKHLVRTCCNFRSLVPEVEVAAKVILVPHDGFLCRSDILELRMRHSQYVDSVIPFSTPDGHLPTIEFDGERTLLTLLSSSPGALLVKQSSTPCLETLDLLGKDLKVRLSFDWVLPTRPVPRTVALVGGRPMFDMKTGSYGSKGPLEAAHALGISVIVLDRPGHWLEGDTYSYLRDDFIAIDMTTDTELPLNITKALKGREVDGIVTFCDDYVIATAEAAEMLRLPTEPVQAILQAHHKDETRKLVNSPNVQVLRLDSAEQLHDSSMADTLGDLRYPLIVKPCRGRASRGVKKVQDPIGLRQAMRKIEDEGLSEHGILLETYVDGPEVDANFVLWDGEILFCEISDDFPCLADATDATIADNFIETLMLLPSGLDPEVIATLRSSLHQSLLQLGFRTGVFHVEARVQNPSMRYKKVDGILDLVDTGATANGRPDVFMIEVNARTPGLDCTFSTLDTYGVDLWALQYLRALGDHKRFAAMSTPFSCLAQYWCGNCQVPMHRDGILVPHDFFDKVLQQLPEIAPHVSRAEFFQEPGTVVSPEEGVGFVAYFLLCSRTSRRHVLEMCARVQDVSEKVLDDV